MLVVLGLDFETRCELDIRKVGLANYLAHPSFQPLIAGIDTEIGPLEFDFVADPMGVKKFLNFLTDPSGYLWAASPGAGSQKQAYDHIVWAAHNAVFERGVMARMGWPKLKIVDTAVTARINGASSRLEFAAPQLLGSSKMDVGRRLIAKFSVGPGPLSVDPGDPDWNLFKSYCLRDAFLARLLLNAKHVHPDNMSEHFYEELTYTMNQVGWPVDIALVKEMLKRHTENCERELAAFREQDDPPTITLPGGEVVEREQLNLSSHKQLKEWCAERGIRAKSFDTAHVDEMLKKINHKLVHDDLPADKYDNYAQVGRMLRLKQTLGGSSLSKLPKILELVSEDGRLRNQYMHAGAGQSARTTGVGVQMQNLKRLKDAKNPRDVDTIYDRSVPWSNDDLAGNIRQVFYAPNPNGLIIVGDFSSVESRGLAYLAGEDWKLEAYHKGQDLYKVLATKIFSVLYENVTPDERQAGKVGELACGYGAAADAVVSFAAGMGVFLTKDQALRLVADWRRANQQITQLWSDLNDALHSAVRGEKAEVRKGNFLITIEPHIPPTSLSMQHPGARSLRIEMRYRGIPVMQRVIQGAYLRGRDICYYKSNETIAGEPWKSWYIDPKTKRREFYRIYGGKLTGILIQSLCREIFFLSLNKVTAAFWGTGVEVIGQFHDEIVLHWDPDKTGMSSAKAMAILEECMTNPDIFDGFPLGAEIKAARRYIK